MPSQTRSKSKGKKSAQKVPKERTKSSASADKVETPEVHHLATNEATLQIDIMRHRFSHYQPQAIDAMSLSFDRKLLAVSRENRTIEIWKADSFTQIVNLPGHRNVDIRNIHWMEPGEKGSANDEMNLLHYQQLKNKKHHEKKRRLVTTGLNGMVSEWDLSTGVPVSKLNCQVPIWDSVMIGKYIYLACEDGSIRILKVKKGKIQMIKLLCKNTCSCLSLQVVPQQRQAQPRRKKTDDSSDMESDDEENNGPTALLFAGYSDGSLKKWDVKTGNCVLHIDKQTQKKKTKEGKCLIWKLAYLNDCLISGDSQGDVCVWDVEFGTQVAKLSQLSGDILALALNQKHGCIYATGVDSRVISVQLQSDPETKHQ